MSFKIEKITAFIAVDDDGEEGIIGQLTPTGWMPFIGADETRISQLYERAEEICLASKKKFKVLQFSVRSDITEKVRLKYKHQ